MDQDDKKSTISTEESVGICTTRIGNGFLPVPETPWI